MSVGQLSRHRMLGLSDDQVLEMYRFMVQARRFDERATVLQRAGKIPFHVSGIGQEPGQVGMAFALQKGKDYLLPYYRDFAFVLAMGMTLPELMLSVFAKAEDPNSGGRQLPGHFGSKRLNMITGSSPVATQIPHAAGIALAAKMQKKDFVTWVSLGEGATNQGDFHEGCNFAGVHQLPMIICCENNQYAISVPYSRQLGKARVADRAAGYGFPGVRVDGNDALEVYRVVKEARERAARGEGPTLIELMMYRISPHSTSDDDMLYRTREEVEENRAKDGIPKFRQYLSECGLWDDEKELRLQEEVKQLIQEATQYADKAPAPKPEDTLRHVFAQPVGEA